MKTKLKTIALLIAQIFARPIARYAEKNLVMYASSDYTLADLDRYDVNFPGSAEKIRQRFYDFLVYPTAGATQFTFFANPKGQGLSASVGNAGNPKTYADTNMELAGQLPSPQAFIAESIEVVFFAGSSTAANTYAAQVPASTQTTAMVAAQLQSINDINAIGIGGFLDLYIGSKTYLRDGPLGSFPPKTNLAIDAAFALATGLTTVQNAITLANGKWVGRPYYLDPPITLRATQNFNITLNWPVAVATPSGNNGKIGVILDGALFRKAQ